MVNINNGHVYNVNRILYYNLLYNVRYWLWQTVQLVPYKFYPPDKLGQHSSEVKVFTIQLIPVHNQILRYSISRPFFVKDGIFNICTVAFLRYRPAVHESWRSSSGFGASAPVMSHFLYPVFQTSVTLLMSVLASSVCTKCRSSPSSKYGFNNCVSLYISSAWKYCNWAITEEFSFCVNRKPSSSMSKYSHSEVSEIVAFVLMSPKIIDLFGSPYLKTKFMAFINCDVSVPHLAMGTCSTIQVSRSVLKHCDWPLLTFWLWM